MVLASLTLLTSSAWAMNKTADANQNMYGSPMLDHGMGERAHALQMELGDAYGSMTIQQPADHTDKAEAADLNADLPVGDS